MRTSISPYRHGIQLACALAALALPAARAADAPAEADAFPTSESYIKVSGTAPVITGDRAAFATRSDVPNSTGTFGIEDLFYTKDLNDTSTVQVNGRALDGSDDYLASVNFSKNDYGTAEVGYKRFRTFYDGVGGFFPLADKFQLSGPEDLHVDRSSFWVNLKLARPDCPVFTLSFHDEIRSGEKDSTEWAAIINPDATVSGAGALVGNAAPVNTPYINPNVLALAEHHNILDGSVTASIGKTTETLKGTLDWVDNIDSRYYIRYPNSKVVVDPTVSVLDDQEAIKTRTLRVINQTETPLVGALSFETGLSFSHVAGEDGGLWITPAYSTTAKAVYPAITAGNIATNAIVDDYVGNAFLKFSPVNWVAELGLRDESNVTSDAGGFTTTSLSSTATTTAATNVTTAKDAMYSHMIDHDLTPEASLSYQGISKLSLYASYDKTDNRGTQHWINPYAAISTTGVGVVTTTAAPIASTFFQTANQNYEDAKIGADWYPTSMVTIRAEVFRKDHQNQYLGSDQIVGTGSYGTLFATGYTFTGTAVSLVLKPVAQLSFTTRYQPQSGNIGVTSDAAAGGTGTDNPSCKARSELLSETVNWSPIKQFYAQASINVAYNYIQTAYPTVVVNTTAPLVPTPIVNSDDNYVTGTALAGFVVDKATDAQIQGTWQQANDYNPQVALGGQPYGASFLYESVTIGLKHKFSDRIMGEGKVGYLRSTDGTTGGFTNYRGPLGYLSVTYSL